MRAPFLLSAYCILRHGSWGKSTIIRSFTPSMNHLSTSRLPSILCAVLLTGGLASCKGHGSRTAGADTGAQRNIRIDTVDITETDTTHDIALFPSSDGSEIILTVHTKLHAVKGDHPGDRT